MAVDFRPLENNFRSMLPVESRRALEQSIVCWYGSAFDAAAVMARRTVEEACIELNLPGRTLANKLKALVIADTATQQRQIMRYWPDFVRSVGNAAAHIGEPISATTSAECLVVCEQFLHALFVQPQINDRYLETRKINTSFQRGFGDIPSGIASWSVEDSGDLKSDGERLVAAYLRQRGFSRFSEYERPVGGKNLDFSIDHPDQSFVMEVYEPEIKIPAGGGPFSSYDGLRGMFERNKQKQIRAAKQSGLPFVGVFARTNSEVDFGPDLVAGAMFGDLTFRMPIADDGESFDIDRGVSTFGSDGKVQPGQMRGVSAVAIVRRFNPTAWKLTKELEIRTAGLPKWHARMDPDERLSIQTTIAKVATEIEDEFTNSGTYDPTAAGVRLIVLHNPYADRSLRMDILSGTHDEQWLAYPDQSRTLYGERWKGSLIGEVLNRS